MRRLLVFSLLITIFTFCTTKPYEDIESVFEDGSPKIVKYYKSDSKEVLIREIRYWESGNKSMEGTYKNGEREGVWTAWYADGTIWSTGEYKNGIENGIKTVYFENGQKYYEGEVKDEIRTGAWKFWDEEGNLVKEINYDIN